MDCLIEVSQLWTLDSAVYGPFLVWLLEAADADFGWAFSHL